jgi:hypothetical protein
MYYWQAVCRMIGTWNRMPYAGYCNLPIWKVAIVTRLLKKDDPTIMDNYRGISVLSPKVKIFKSALSRQFIQYFETYGLLTDMQHDFRASLSCKTALHTILNHWHKNSKLNKVIAAIFVDFRKAFDTVDHSLLLRKLFHYGFDNNSLALLANYFGGRKQCVKVNGMFSTMIDQLLGVPGSTLGPLFFLIFINDLSFVMENRFHLFFCG